MMLESLNLYGACGANWMLCVVLWPFSVIVFTVAWMLVTWVSWSLVPEVPS